MIKIFATGRLELFDSDGWVTSLECDMYVAAGLKTEQQECDNRVPLTILTSSTEVPERPSEHCINF